MGLCFAYMDKPDTEKHSNDESNEKLNCGTSFMQGWRETQEDAYNCILDYDSDTSYFAVYDGHGGEEVALYCSQKLPDFLKQLEDYKVGNIEKAMEDAFLQFDASLLTNEVSEELQELRNQVYKERKKKEDNRSDSSCESEEEDVDSLYKEAVMPIEELVEKYKKGEIYKDHVKGPKKQASCSSKDTATSCSNNSELPETSGVIVGTSTSVKNDVSVKENNSNHKTSDSKNCTKVESKVDVPDSSGDVKDTCTPSTTSTEKEIISQNGKFESVQNSESTKPNVSSLPQILHENGEVIKKGKGKAVTKTKGVTIETPTPQRPKRKTKTELGQMLLSSEEEDEEFEDEKDLTFEGPDDSSDDDDDDDEYEEMNDSPRTSEDSSVEDEDDERTKRHEKFCKSKQERNEENWSTPFDSAFKCGTTAVVALLRGNELYVANAGDSRCVLCRNGKAIAMSFDHNPFLAQEEARIEKAGGYVGRDGRVNGGLNLSRALGDHSYKQNKELSDREQIITALPDVKTITIKPDEDEFLILACDGIWNSMSRQKVVDFVRTRIEGGQQKMSAICEELFDNCLSPHTFVDGSGCDNMTAVIVQFKHKKSLKKSLSDSDLEEEEKSKKMKSSNDA